MLLSRRSMNRMTWQVQKKTFLQFLRRQNADEGKVKPLELWDKIAFRTSSNTHRKNGFGSVPNWFAKTDRQFVQNSSKNRNQKQIGRELLQKTTENELEQNALIDEERKALKDSEEALVKFPTQYTWKDIYLLIIKKLKSYDRKS